MLLRLFTYALCAAVTAQRAELLDYNPVANASAVIVDSTGTARFTVLTPRLIRMELSRTPGVFEDRATIAFVNRDLPVPAFSHSEAEGVLTISTAAVQLVYAVGEAFNASTLTVRGLDAASNFSTWAWGDLSPGNLLGTIRGLDHQRTTSLNCTTNRGIDDNGEYNHCEWGIPSRDGWTIVNDTSNFALGADDWWAVVNTTARPCPPLSPGLDAVNPQAALGSPAGATVADAAACCSACDTDATCLAGFVFDATPGASPNCFPLMGWSGTRANASRSLAIHPSTNNDAEDIYGFFHGHDYFGAMNDFVAVCGRVAMIPRFASGIWASRWYDYSQRDSLGLIDDFFSRRLPLDVVVYDMNWHLKNDWGGWTFDGSLFPFAADSNALLHAHGLGVLVNAHDSDGVSDWENLFPALIEALHLPADTTNVPLNLLNKTIALAVEDVIIGDLLHNKNVDAVWIDWQSGGFAGGLTGDKQNPTFWLSRLRSTDRHRKGDSRRGLVLSRFGGLGAHRFQVGFSGDVLDLDWPNMRYQPYFSATASNVGFSYWSHDIVGPSGDDELFTRWTQVGAFSGTMRFHDRGLASGNCNNVPSSNATSAWLPQCATVEPWKLASDTVFTAVRAALQLRAELLPYIYTRARAAFDTGVGLVIPVYYLFPEHNESYLIDASGEFSSYFFGLDILFSPVVTPSSITNAFGPGLATKSTWLPPGLWYDSTTGAMIASPDTGTFNNGTFVLQHVPLFFRAGAVIPFLSLSSLPSSVGAASQQYAFLGFKIVPGASNGSGTAYEDDGSTTAYLSTAAYAATSLNYTIEPTSGVVSITISTVGSYPELPPVRAYQIRLLNSRPLANATLNGAPLSFARFGAASAQGRLPTSSSWRWEVAVSAQGGMGVVVDLVGVSTTAPATLVLSPAADGPRTAAANAAAAAGAFGVMTRGTWAKTNLDLDRSTPGSQSVGPSWLAKLSTASEALASLAGTINSTAFDDTLANALALYLPGALADIVSDARSPRANFSRALLTLL